MHSRLGADSVSVEGFLQVLNVLRFGENNLARIIEEKVVNLLKQKDAKEVDSVFDASFIKAWSTRDTH